MPAPRTIALNGVEYSIDTRAYSHASRKTERDMTAIAGEASDSLFDTGGAWMRYRHSWHHGRGQLLDDLGDDNVSPFRFDTAENLHIWDNGSLTIQPGWDRIHELTASAGSEAALSIANGFAVASNGSSVWQADSTALVTWTAVTGMAGARQIATDGVAFYLANSSNLYRLVAGAGGATVLSAGSCDNVAFVANRLLIGVGAALYEVAAGGTRTLIETHFQSSFRWNVIFGIGSRIYAGGYAGSRGELYSLITDSGGALVPSAEASPLEPGEYLLNAVAYAGFVVLLSNRGARFAQVGADGTLNYGPLISAGFGSTLLSGLAVGGGWAWFQQFAEDGSGDVLMVEMDLTTFVDTLRPAFTVVARTAGDDTAYKALLYADPNGQDKVVLGVDQTTSYVAKYGPTPTEDSELVTGNVTTGLIRFGTVEDKVLVDIVVGFDPLPANTTVGVTVRDEAGTTVATGSTSTDGATELVVSLEYSTVRGCTVELELSQSALGATPTVRFWRMRAWPVAPPVQEWVLPIINAEAVVMGEGEGAEMAQIPFDVENAIVALWESKEQTTLAFGAATYAVRVADFEVREPRWGDDGTWLQSTLLVRCVNV
jgi:hypothetical protein